MSTNQTIAKSPNLLSRRLTTLRQDTRGSALWMADLFGQACLSWFTSMYCRVVALAWGIDLGTSCWFDGVTEFKRYPTSTIRIGSHCRFRSTFRSNMVGINRPCGISTYSKDAQIIIGNKCGFSGAIVGAARNITLGEHVLCGANVLITDFDWHAVGIDKDADSSEAAEPVLIADNVWIGINSVILKGSQIGSNSIIGANSLVTSHIPADVIAGGIPARVIRKLQN